MKRLALTLVLAAATALPVCAQTLGWPDPLQQQTYTPRRASSTDPTGANHDSRIKLHEKCGGDGWPQPAA